MDVHAWVTPDEIAERLQAHKYREGWATCCPAHGGDNPRAFTIKRGTDSHGNPCTLLYCHTHRCDIRDICAALDVPLAALFAIHPDYARQTRNLPRAHSPRIERLRKGQEPASQDDLAQLMLEEMIRSDPVFLAECPPARETFWRLAQEPSRKLALIKALSDAKLPVQPTLDALRQEWEGP